MCVGERWAASLSFVRVLDGEYFLFLSRSGDFFFVFIAVGRVFYILYHSVSERGFHFFIKGGPYFFWRRQYQKTHRVRS